MPAAEVKSQRIIILWEHEIRIAAKAIDKIRGENPTQEDYQNALKACYVALYHPDLANDNCPVTIMSINDAPIKRRRKKSS